MDMGNLIVKATSIFGDGLGDVDGDGEDGAGLGSGGISDAGSSDIISLIT